ncbi:hypothetical protein FISHEDRAFT_67816 [Fistulina hepatica ATCC 64428]|nr:hypothetical protein FISHEDRAFT_67816 [Fistulina hepatica ATCC 64428]
MIDIVEPPIVDPNPDVLFLERFEAFMDKIMSEIRQFAERESRPVDEIRRRVATVHASHLFPRITVPAVGGRILREITSVLESLDHVFHIESFLLAVEPYNKRDTCFFGGSLSGREFWRGRRGGGSSGASAFRQYCLRHAPKTEVTTSTVSEEQSSTSGALPASSTSKMENAKTLKSDLYDLVRQLLRYSYRLVELYGVRLVGWPAHIPKQNPSTLKVGQNRELLDAFKTGKIYFEYISRHSEPASHVPQPFDGPPPTQDFSWAIRDDARLPERIISPEAGTTCQYLKYVHHLQGSWHINRTIYVNRSDHLKTWMKVLVGAG